MILHDFSAMNDKNNNKVTKVFRTIAVVAAAFAGFATIIYRFEHPKLTDTEILINLWKMYAVILFLCLVYAVTSRFKNEK